MAAPESCKGARELVQKITKDHGYVSPEVLEALDPTIRREIEEALLRKDMMIGSSVLTLAKNLYTSKARFVFELIQNADDNSYDKAKRKGDMPYLSFQVFQDRIIVECNEDGFTTANLAAICNIGKSSKTGAQGYIGEKGIGFKSVFMAASKVHIQSGFFSFSFRHKPGDSGMGMITPIWEDATDDATKELPLPLTRFTLYMNTDGDAELLTMTRDSILTQFAELQETFLLFMKNIAKIRVVLHGETAQQTSETEYALERPSPTYAVLKKTSIVGGSSEESVKYFHVTTHEATGLPKNENRTYSEAEERTRPWRKSQVILAFPLSESHEPIEDESQYLFVFLPVRPVGLNFLIHGDFVTDASRQDVVLNSLRNVQLIEAVASAFIKATSQFCQHDNLRYSWVRYLPKTPSTGWLGLWLKLVMSIAEKFRQAKVLYAQVDPTSPRSIMDLCRINGDLLDEHNQPLFEEEYPGKVISQGYSDKDIETLSSYGLRLAGWPDIIEWVRQDLKRDWYMSRTKSFATSATWHEKVARLLISGLDQRSNIASEIKKLELIPLLGGYTWTSAKDAKVYFPKIGKLEIPSTIDLRLVTQYPGEPMRNELFRRLGVETASVPLVRQSILVYYRRKTPDPETSRCHLEFLYRTEGFRSETEESYDLIKLHDRSGNVLEPSRQTMYIANDDPYGPWELFRPTQTGPNPGDGAPGYPASFLHEKYLVDPPADIDALTTWLGWFCDGLSVRKHVNLEDPDVREYIEENRPEKFLGAVHGYYSRLGHTMNPEFIETLRGTRILCRGNTKYPCRYTMTPTADLVRRYEKYLGEDVSFPLIQLEFEAPSIFPLSWRVMFESLRINVPSDTKFAVYMVFYFVCHISSRITPEQVVKLFDLYDHLQERYWASETRNATRRLIRNIFSNNKVIYIPLPGGRAQWALPNECVWDGPKKMKSKFVLKKLYGHCFCRDGPDCIHFPKFFVDTVGISASCTWQDYIEELKAFKAECNSIIDDQDGDWEDEGNEEDGDEEEGDELGGNESADDDCQHAETIRVIYTAINALRRKGEDSMDIRAAFEEHALVYTEMDGNPTWHKPSQCVWSDAIRLRGAVSLSEEYGDLEDLFLQVLGVAQVNLDMAVAELELAGSRQPVSLQEVKESIWTVNSLLPAEGAPPAPVQVVESSIFPIRYPHGDVACSPRATSFFIVDWAQLKQHFEDRVKMLDFSLEDVSKLRPFLQWAGVQDRYLSRCAREVTAFPGDEGRPELSLSLKIRQRAHPLLRIACHFNSPRSRSVKDMERLYEMLKSTRVMATEAISSRIEVVQDGKHYGVESSRTTLHLEENGSSLAIYVPCDREDQQYIFGSKLPGRILMWMMTDPATKAATRTNASDEKDGVHAIRDVMAAPYARLSEALEENGIGMIPIENTDEAPPTTTSSIGDGIARDEVEYEEALTPASGSEVPPSGFGSATRPFHLSMKTGGESHEFALAPFQLPTPTRYDASHPYVEDLGRVIAAGRRGSLPFHSEGNEARQVISRRRTGLESTSGPERDCMVGAAGELYVFELLSHLSGTGLPGFNYDNWQSHMRNYVTSHPDYAEMSEWPGPETSDMTYEDRQGALTHELIEKGYLDRGSWEGEKPRYLIEVKSTTGSWDRQFYLSMNQYQRMQTHTNATTNNNKATIYAIFRVYSVGQDDMGLAIYLDPESLRRSRQLIFEGGTWTVVPRAS
ncbi:hypothetical protein F5Y17DRAFT_437188 [Xylariaceae sp. FL0594]|nr:hypothetical protein F5Y17DRAFT_437188 [Xylariaceae sp. FL0594]